MHINNQTTGEDSPLISIIIPARNEAEDISGTLEVCLAIDYEPKEIIVVDDSTDETPQIVASYADRGVRLIHRDDNKNGCCGARNLGMKIATGEIVVLMNADNRPSPDFLRRLLVNYKQGADYVIVKSMILNRNEIWGKYTYSHGMMLLSENPVLRWSEGFSCRKAAAEAVGYLPGDFPVPFCRDWMLGASLAQAGYRKIVDFSIEMKHIWPSTFRSYWNNQVHRGAHSSPSAYYFKGLCMPSILFREVLKAVRTGLKYLLILPAICRIVRISKFAPRGWRDIPVLLLASLVNDTATIVGNFKGWARVAHEESWTARAYKFRHDVQT